MDDDEIFRFSQMEIDRNTGHRVPPPVSYWTARNGLLSQLQREYVDTLFDRIGKGDRDFSDVPYEYQLLFSDEVSSRIGNGSERDFDQKEDLVFKIAANNQADNMRIAELWRQLQDLREARFNRSLRSQPVKSRWVPLGQEVTLDDGTVITRGGFYLGTHMFQANPLAGRPTSAGKKSSVEDKRMLISDIVLEPAMLQKAGRQLADDNPAWRRREFRFASLRSMTPAQQAAYYRFLTGELPLHKLDPDLVEYYLAGMEYRLFVDEAASDEERRDISRFLASWLTGEVVPALRYPLRGNENWEPVVSLVDHALALFLPEEIQPMELETDLFPTHQKVLMQKRLSAHESEKLPSLLKHLRDLVPVPEALPEDLAVKFVDSMMEYIRKHYSYISIGHSRFGEMRLQHRCFANTHYGSRQLASLSVRTGNRELGQFLGRYTELYHAFSRVRVVRLSELVPFLQAVRSHGLDRAETLLTLPSYLGIFDLPEVKALAAKWLPEDCSVMVLPLESILEGMKIDLTTSEAYYSLHLDLTRRFYRLGISMSPSYREAKGLGKDDFVALYRMLPEEDADGGIFLPVTMPLFLQALPLIQAVNGLELKQEQATLIDDWIKQVFPTVKMPSRLIGVRSKKSLDEVTLENYRRYALAHYKAYIRRKRTITKSIKEGILTWREDHRRMLALLLLKLHSSLGTKESMKGLLKVLPLLGVDADSVHSMLHTLQTTGSVPQLATKAEQKEAAKKRGRGAAALDRERVRAIQEDTHDTQSMLSEVFEDREEKIQKEKQEKAPKSGKAKAGKPAESPVVALLRALSGRDSWSREELEELCKPARLVPNSALEEINDMAYDRLDDAVVDDEGDSITVYTDMARELLSQL